jgi:hypothetical protein
MRDDFRRDITLAVLGSKVDRVLDLIAGEYEFTCPSFVYAGPGHQSKHVCELNRPHPLDGEHGDDMYEWTGTTIMVEGKLLINAPHRGDGRCGH